MIDPCYSLPSDVFQLLVTWLDISMQSHRRGRHFLKKHPLLLDIETDRELARLIAANAEDNAETMQQHMRHQLLLRDARGRGASSTAIDEAYVNIYGGFALDLPAYLTDFEAQQIFLDRLRRPDRTSKTSISLLRNALALSVQDTTLAPEIQATLQQELALLLTHHVHPYTQAARIEALREAIACHEASLLTFTYHRYPSQYAKACMHLGTTWIAAGITDYPNTIGQAGATERAIACYAAALHVYTPGAFPEQWAQIQTLLGNAYALRSVGEPGENLERAIAYHEAALQNITSSTFPTVWAMAQINLGNTLRLRIMGDPVAHFKRAMTCYKAALQVYTQKLYPREWAAIHSGLATAFQHHLEEDAEEQDKLLRCAIVCYEGVLNVYTLDAFPADYAATQVKLGNVHYQRQGGDRLTNLEQAIVCYQEALTIFTCDTFPLQYRQTLLKLQETTAQREEWMQHAHQNNRLLLNRLLRSI